MRRITLGALAMRGEGRLATTDELPRLQLLEEGDCGCSWAGASLQDG